MECSAPDSTSQLGAHDLGESTFPDRHREGLADRRRRRADAETSVVFGSIRTAQNQIGRAAEFVMEACLNDLPAHRSLGQLIDRDGALHPTLVQRTDHVLREL